MWWDTTTPVAVSTTRRTEGKIVSKQLETLPTAVAWIFTTEDCRLKSTWNPQYKSPVVVETAYPEVVIGDV
jgi:hypothetical protein